jgi:hypothetical protein
MNRMKKGEDYVDGIYDRQGRSLQLKEMYERSSQKKAVMK